MNNAWDELETDTKGSMPDRVKRARKAQKDRDDKLMYDTPEKKAEVKKIMEQIRQREMAEMLIGK